MKLTLKELQDLTSEDLLIKVAECCGWTEIHVSHFVLRGNKVPDGYCQFDNDDDCDCFYDEPIPDYVFDLSAMCSMWKEKLGYFSNEWFAGYKNLCLVASDDLAGYMRSSKKDTQTYDPDRVQEMYLASLANASAIQWAWAFILTLQKD